jgi:methanogenic corrinoid protein MtbC1
VRGVVKLVREMRPDVLAISVTIPPNLKNAAALIAAVRADPHIASTRILVGGVPFNHIPDLWKQIGADGCARDAAGALAWANGKVELS